MSAFEWTLLSCRRYTRSARTAALLWLCLAGFAPDIPGQTMAHFFSNPEPLTIIDIDSESGPLAPYPSTISVSGLTQAVVKVTVTLNDLSYVSPDDLDILLVGPGGQNVMLMSDCGGFFENEIVDVTITLDDDAATALPDTDPRITTGTYRPANYGSPSSENGLSVPFMPPPAPRNPYGNRLGVFEGTNPNGDWSLYVNDDLANDSGQMAGGWSMTLTLGSPLADLSLTQAASASVAAGSNLTYTITVTNNGPADGLATLVDTLPASVNFISAAASQGSCTNAAGVVTCALGNLLSGNSAQVTLVILPSHSGQISNTATISTQQLDPVSSNNTATMVTTVMPSPDLAITVAPASQRALLQQPLTFAVTVTNQGTVPATAVTLRDTLPRGMSFVSAISNQGSCTNAGNIVHCDLGTLPAGGSVRVTISGIPSLLGSNTNFAAVTSGEIDAIATNNFAQAIVIVEPAADLVLNLLSSPATVPLGANWTLTLLVSNQGPNSSTVVLSEVLPARLNFVSASGSRGVCSNDNGRVICQLGNLDSGDIATVTIIGETTVSGPLTRSLSVSGSVGDPVASNNVVVATATVIPAADLAIRVTDMPDPLLVGEEVTYLVSITNRGPNRATGVVITNQLPAGMTLVALESSIGGCEVSSNFVLCNLASLKVGVSASITIVALPQFAGLFTNVAGISGVEADQTPANNFAVQRTVVQLGHLNRSPVLSAISDQTTLEDTALTVPFVASDPDSPADGLIYSASSSDPALVPVENVTFGGSGTNRMATILPGTNRSGSATITLTARDFDGASVSRIFLLTVLPVNDLPTLGMINDITVDEDSRPFTVPLAGISSGAPDELQNLRVTARSDNLALIPHPSVNYTSPSELGTLTLAPVTNRFGSATITVTVTDGQPTNNLFSRTFVLNVQPINDPPVIARVSDAVTREDTAISIPIAVSDADDPASDLTLSASSSNAALVPSANVRFSGSDANRIITILPGTNQFGTAAVTITVTDRRSASNSATFVLTVIPVNDPPTLDLISDRTVSENSGTQVVPLSGISGGPANEPQNVSITVTSSNPSLIPNPTLLYTNPAATGALTFRPATNASGNAKITVTVDDGQSTNRVISRSFMIIVTPVNTAPSISAITNRATDEDVPITVPFTVSDRDTPAPLLVLSSVSSNPALVANTNIIFDGAGTNRTVRITPRPDQSGTTTITLRVSDGMASNSTSFLLTVNPVNDPPTLDLIPTFLANAQNGNPRFDLPITGITSGATNENQTLTVTATSSNPNFIPNPVVAYASPNTSGTLALRPARQTTGSAIITVTVDDGGASNNLFSRTFIANIKSSANTAPTIAGITNVTLNEDTPSGPIPFTVRDAETPAANLTLFAASSNPLLLPTNNISFGGSGTNRTFSLMPAANRSGTAEITLTVTDAGFGSSNRTFTVTVLPVNDAPTISSITNQFTAEETPTGPILFTIADVDNSPDTLGVTASSGNTNLVPASNIAIGGSDGTRALIITPATNQSGSAVITVRVTDGLAANSTSFTLTVGDVNDPPVISSIPDQTIDAGTSTPLIPFTVQDLETSAGTLTLSAASSNPSLVPTNNIVFAGSGANRTLMITPRSGELGAATITVTVSDPNGGSASTSFVLTVNPTNRAPTLTAISNLSINENAGLQTILLSGIGPGGTNENQPLAVTAATADSSLIANLAVDYTSPNSTATLYIQPVPFAHGTATIRVTVNDGQSQNNLTTRSFVVNINAAPTFSDLLDVTMLEDAPMRVVNFSVADLESPAASLRVTAASSNPALLPAQNIRLDGSGANRTIGFTPLTNQNGVSFITLTLTDPNGATTTNGFFITVLPVTDSIVITTQPKGLTVLAGDAVSFTVAATSTLMPLRYQWRRDGMALAGATNAVLVIPVARGADAGIYSVSISNGDGAQISAAARLYVVASPNIVSITHAQPMASVSFSSLSGLGYTLEFKDRVTDPFWTPLRTITGDGSVMTINDPTATGPMRFYRLRVLASSEIVSITREGSVVNVAFTTLPRLTYTLEFKDSLDTVIWTPIGTISGDGTVMTMQDPAALSRTGFYRVRVE